MSAAKYVLLAWFALSVLLNIGMIGKHRKPLEPSTVALATIITAGLAWLVVIA